MGIKKIVYKKIPYIFCSQPTEEDEYALFKCGGKLLKVEPSTALFFEDPLGMATLRKRKIKKAQKEGVIVVESSDKSDYERFIEIQNDILTTRHGVKAVHTSDEIFLLHSRFPMEIKLYFASLDGEMLGGTIIFVYRNAIHTQYMCSNDTGRDLGALDLVIGTVIEQYKDSKKWLDFGISSEDNGHIFNEGLTSQKEGFGGRTVTYKTWEIDID